jgi:hypothetical protein
MSATSGKKRSKGGRAAPAKPYMSRLLCSTLQAAKPKPLPGMTLALVLWQFRNTPASPVMVLHVHAYRLCRLLRAAAEGRDVEYVEREGVAFTRFHGQCCAAEAAAWNAATFCSGVR